MDRITLEHRRLEREEEVAEEELLAAQRLTSERTARLVRLRKQKRLLREKGKVMVERGLKDLDELEAAEKAEATATVQVPSVAPGTDFD